MYTNMSINRTWKNSTGHGLLPTSNNRVHSKTDTQTKNCLDVIQIENSVMLLQQIKLEN